MVKRRIIRPAEEEIGNLLPIILFVVLWYSGLGSIIINQGFQASLLIFLAAGLAASDSDIHQYPPRFVLPPAALSSRCSRPCGRRKNYECNTGNCI